MSEKLSKACLILAAAGEELLTKRGKGVEITTRKSGGSPPALEILFEIELLKGSDKTCECSWNDLPDRVFRSRRLLVRRKVLPFHCPMKSRGLLSPEFLPLIQGPMKSSSTSMKTRAQYHLPTRQQRHSFWGYYG
jgi:hypothetical protein